MKIYYVRHGESADAANNLYQRLDTPLSENGKKQAVAVAQELKSIRFDVVLTSPLQRAKETAEIICKALNCKITIMDSLQEEKRPGIIEGKSREDPVISELLKEVYSNYGNTNYRHSDEDTYEMLKTKAMRLKKDLENLHSNNVLVVGHGTLLKMLVAILKYGDTVSSLAFIRFSDTNQLPNVFTTTLVVEKGNWQIPANFNFQ